jgi:hypothetical protein
VTQAVLLDEEETGWCVVRPGADQARGKMQPVSKRSKQGASSVDEATSIVSDTIAT